MSADDYISFFYSKNTLDVNRLYLRRKTANYKHSLILMLSFKDEQIRVIDEMEADFPVNKDTFELFPDFQHFFVEIEN